MRNTLTALALMLALAGTMPHTLAAKNTMPQLATPAVANEADAQEQSAITAMLADLQAASNRHDIEGVLKHYAPGFTSGDSLNLKDIRALILDTWSQFPDIHYDSEVLEIRLSGNWATVETLDTATALAKVDPAISDQPGKLVSQSRSLLYLHKVGRAWEIVSDYVLYEKALIAYGPVDTVPVEINTPEQVFAGESYSAKLDVGVPTNNIAFAMIAKEPLVYPQEPTKNKFRTLSSEKTTLERIFSANTTNNNEVVTATIGFTQIGQDDQDRPTINLSGVLTVIKRVNVIPKSTYSEVSEQQGVVRTTADGKIKVEGEENPEHEGEGAEEGGDLNTPDFESEPLEE